MRTARRYRDFRELLDRNDIDAVLIATGPNWHCTAALNAARAGKDMYCEKPCTKNIAQSLILAETMRRTGRVFQAGTQRRNLPHFAFACELARTGQARKAQNGLRPPGRDDAHDERLVACRTRTADKEVVDWDMYLGPPPGGRYNAKLLDGFNFEKGGGLVGGGVLEWGSHCVDLCQWAVGNDRWAPVEYNPPKDGQMVARYAERRRAGLPREGLDSARLVPGAIRRRNRLGRNGRQRQNRAQLARIARRPHDPGGRRLSGHIPRSRFPRLRQDAQPAQRATPTRPATRTSPATRRTSPLASTGR